MSNPMVERAHNLFEFLRRAQQLKTSSPSTVDSYQRDGAVLWLADAPEHDAVRTTHDMPAPQPDEALLTVDRVSHIDPPEPGEELEPWLRDELDNPKWPPQLRPAIFVEDETQPMNRWPGVHEERTRARKITLDENPDIRRRYDSWLNAWQAWAEQESHDRPAREYYATLFEAYVRATSNPENLELVVAMGCLSWSPAGHRDVQRHLLTCPAAIHFDDNTARLSVHRMDAPVAFKVELDMLEPRLVNNPDNVNNVIADAREIETHPLHRENIGALARRLVHSLDADGEYRDSDSAAEPAGHAVGAFAPAIILRKRTQQGMVEIFQTIVDQLTEAEDVPDGIRSLLDPDHVPESSPATEPGAVVDLDGESYLPMPVNDKQLDVIRRVDQKAQVLVQGPPGTGKTYTAAALISHLLAQGKRVLVTAQTDRALREVRDKLPDAIKPLAVGVVGTSREDMADLKVAVQEIAAATVDHDAAANAADIQRCLDIIDRLRRERAELHHQLVAARECEIIHREHAGYTGTLAAIARTLTTQTERYEWLTSHATVGAQERSPLSNTEITEWRDYLLDTDLIADESESRMRLLEVGSVPVPDTFAELVVAERQAAEGGKAHEQLKGHTAFDPVLRLRPEQRDQLRHRLHKLADEADVLASRREQWMNDALADVRSGRAGVWQNRGHNIGELVTHCQPVVAQLGALTEVVMPAGDTGGLVNLAREVHRYLNEGGKIKTNADGSPKVGALTSKVLKQAQPLFEHVRVNGVPPTTAEHLHIVATWADATRTLGALDRAWPDSVHVPAEDTLHERLQWHITELEQLRRVLDLGSKLETEERNLTAAGLPAPDWNDLQAVRTYARLVDAAAAEEAWEAAAQPLRQLAEMVDGAARWDQAAPTVRQLREAVQARDHNTYGGAYRRLLRLWQARSMTARRTELGARLAEQAPVLARKVSDDPDAEAWTQRLGEFEQAWAWASTRSWVRTQESSDVNAMQTAVVRAEDQIHTQIAKMAALRAWDHAASPERITGRARADLTNYAQLVRRAGRGTGKYGAQRMAEVRDAMDRCRPSVPTWIMPLYRIAEQLRITPDMFDVVIVDEASQAGTEASFLQYLARKIVVIGDDKQVSPSAVGIDQQQLRDLAGQYIADDRYRASWQDPKRSLFDEAKMRYGGLITLTEHRRCVPEIIGFSNRIAYEPDGIRLVPVRQYGTDRLDPVKTVHLTDGYVRGTTNKINPVEVEAIVEQIEKCIADPAYDGKTFGVISLLGGAQAKEIQNRLLNRIPGKEWKARDLRCGDAPDFQGSERDVMFLSMVAAPEEGIRLGSLTGEQYVQRFNVAYSRAKDQIWVFHSVDLQQLHNREDMRFALLDYSYGVANRRRSTEEGLGSELAPEGERVEPFDSLFEQRVYNRIVDRGYTVLPQYEAAGYRIDLVVLGGQRRLAVECDGDEWHGPEVYERDLARQRDLERCGWQFFRIPGSAFDCDRAAALAGLWDTLHELGIHPAGYIPDPEYASEPEPQPEFAHAGLAAPDPQGPFDIEASAGDLAELVPQEIVESAEQAEQVEQLWPVEEATVATIETTETAGGTSPFEPYQEYFGPLDPVYEAAPNRLIEGLEEIVRAEGPILGNRLHSVYVQASGGARVSKQIARVLNSAISTATRRGVLVADDPLHDGGVKLRTYRLPEQPAVRVRQLGSRQLDQIPPAELAAIMVRCADERGWESEEEVFRDTLDQLGFKRLTKQVREHLETVYALVRRTSDVGPD